jgi:hypothetical protein
MPSRRRPAAPRPSAASRSARPRPPRSSAPRSLAPEQLVRISGKSPNFCGCSSGLLGQGERALVGF